MKNTTKINAENKNPVFYMGIFVYTVVPMLIHIVYNHFARAAGKLFRYV